MFLRLLLVALLLATAGCTGRLAKNHTHETPAVEPPPPKKPEEPAAKKPEPTEKFQPPALRQAEQELAKGVKNYENGEYKTAAINLQNALSGGLASTADQITAHKFLAFIYCVSKERMACRGEFKEILTLNIKFELTPAEAGHPIWGPVFREVRAETVTKKKRRK